MNADDPRRLDVLSAYRAYQRHGHASQAYLERTERLLRRLDARVPLTEASANEIEAFLDTGPLDPQSWAYYRALLASFYYWAAAHGHRADDPMERVKRPRTNNARMRIVAGLLLVGVWARVRFGHWTSFGGATKGQAMTLAVFVFVAVLLYWRNAPYRTRITAIVVLAFVAAFLFGADAFGKSTGSTSSTQDYLANAPYEIAAMQAQLAALQQVAGSIPAGAGHTSNVSVDYSALQSDILFLPFANDREVLLQDEIKRLQGEITDQQNLVFSLRGAVSQVNAGVAGGGIAVVDLIGGFGGLLLLCRPAADADEPGRRGTAGGEAR